ncbi:MAG: lactate utilization protein [Elusimicrobiota bacterium]
MEENKKKAIRLVLENTKKALIKNGFKAEVCEGKEEAAEKILSLIGEGKKVGMGGSVTVSQLGLPERIISKNTIYAHKPQMSTEERRKTWLACMDSDFYLASPQAVTSDGKLIFIDGTGNRCAALTWGPKHIILPAGYNKIVKDLQEGRIRMRQEAAIANNIRLNKKNPCVISGKCEDCASPDRICNIVTEIWKKPKISEYSVFLINEDLGY